MFVINDNTFWLHAECFKTLILFLKAVCLIFLFPHALFKKILVLFLKVICLIFFCHFLKAFSVLSLQHHFDSFEYFIQKNSLILYWIAVLLYFVLRKLVTNRRINTTFCSSLQVHISERWTEWKVSAANRHSTFGVQQLCPFLSLLLLKRSRADRENQSQMVDQGGYNYPIGFVPRFLTNLVNNDES